MIDYKIQHTCFLVMVAILQFTTDVLASMATTDHFPSSIPLRWSGENSRLPLEQRGSAVPIIPEGHKKYQFYLYGPSGQLTLQWLTLQQVQNLLLAMDPRGELYNMVTQEDGEVVTTPPNQTRPKDTVQQVIASVQQVISDEVAHNQHQQNPPLPINGSAGQSIEIPDVILQNLMLLQHFTTPWYAPATGRPSTLPESFTTNWPLNTEPTTQETITDTPVTTVESEVHTADISNDGIISEASVDDSMTTVLRPLVDRWNSRFPAWSMLGSEEENGEADKLNELDTTDDYHSLPVSVSETVIPSSNGMQSDEGSTTAWNYESETTIEMQNNPEGTTKIPLTTTKESLVTQLAPVTYANHEKHTTTNKLIDEFYLTTLGSIYGGTLTAKKPAYPQSPPATEATESVVTVQEEAFTLSPLQSAVITIATNLLDDRIQTTFVTKPLPTEEYVSHMTESSLEITTISDASPLVSAIEDNESLESDSSHVSSSNHEVTSLPQDNNENLLQLGIRDPLLPLTIYDIQPFPDPTTTITPQTEKPDNPYDTPTAFLTVTSYPQETTELSYEPDTTSQSESLYDALQNQGYIPTNNAQQIKPYYEFPVYVEDPATQPPTYFTAAASNEESNNKQTTIEELIADLSSKLEATTKIYESGSQSIQSIQPTTIKENNAEKTTTSQLTNLPLSTDVPSTQSVYEFQNVAPTSQNDSLHDPQNAITETPSKNEQSSTGERPATYDVPKRPSFAEYIYYYYEDIGEQGNVLPPTQLANNENQSRIDLEALQIESNHTDGNYFYDYLDQPVYLDDVPEEYYDYAVHTPTQGTLNVTGGLDFPGPNATSPYHEHHHHDPHHHGDHGAHHKDHDSVDNVAQLLEVRIDNPGLEATVETLDPDIRNFIDVVNDITFKVYKQAARQYKRKNFVMSPLSLISTLNILLLGARGSTSAALSDFLLSDQFYTFNPHLILKNVTESLLQMSRIHDVAFFKQLLVEKAKNPYPMDFFSRTVEYFYGANISEMESTKFDKKIQETVNEVISNATRGAVPDFLSDTPLYLTPPLSLVSTNFFHGRWNLPITEADLFDMNFIRFPTAERRLIRTVGIQKRMVLNAGYSKEVGVTTAEVPFFSPSGELSLVLVMPGEQKNFVANGLAQLEADMSVQKWGKILRSMMPNTVMFKMPFFRHRSFHNFSSILNNMGLEEIFKDSEADFSGINTVKTLHVSDVIQLTEFQSCQVVESPGGGTSNSRRAKISPVYTSNTDKHQMTKRQVLEPTGFYSPTFIYGLPMTEYLRRDIDNATRLDIVKNDESDYFKNSSPNVIRFRPLSTMSGNSNLPNEVLSAHPSYHSKIFENEKPNVESNVNTNSQEVMDSNSELEEAILGEIIESTNKPKAASLVKEVTLEDMMDITDDPKVTMSLDIATAETMDYTEEPKAASYWDRSNMDEVNENTGKPKAASSWEGSNVEELTRNTEEPKSASYWPGSYANEALEKGTEYAAVRSGDANPSSVGTTPPTPSSDNIKNHKEDTLTTSALYDESLPGYYYDYYGEGNMYLDPEDYRVNRMGIPVGAANEDGVRESAQSPGEYYRQSDVGALAFDRAFMYAVRHNPTGLLLFVGRYLDPEGN